MYVYIYLFITNVIVHLVCMLGYVALCCILYSIIVQVAIWEMFAYF